MPPFFVDGLPIGLWLNQLANYCLLRRLVKASRSIFAGSY